MELWRPPQQQQQQITGGGDGGVATSSISQSSSTNSSTPPIVRQQQAAGGALRASDSGGNGSRKRTAAAQLLPQHHNTSSSKDTSSSIRGSKPADDAPMTPVVLLVVWTSVVIGGLNGYAAHGTVAARQAPSYIYTFGGSMSHYALTRANPFCSTGVDGLPGVTWYEALTSMLPAVVAPLLAAVYIRRRGRTRGIMAGAVLMIVGLVLMASASHVIQLYIAFAAVQAASDTLYLAVMIKSIEVAPRSARGAFLLSYILGHAVGQALVTVVGYVIASSSALGWRLLLGMGVVPAGAVLAVVPWMVDTPQSFIERGKYAKGWAALRDIRGPFYEDTYAEYMSIVVAAARAPKGFRMYSEAVTNRRFLPALVVGVAMALLSAQLDPQSRSYVAYNTLVRANVPLRSAALMTTLTQSVAYAIGTIICVLLADRLGRLPLLKASSLTAIAVTLVLIVAGVVFAVQHGIRITQVYRPHEDSWAYLQMAALSMLAAGNGVAWSSAAWVIITESQHLAVRPAAVALCIAATNLSASVVENHLLCALKVLYYLFLLVVGLLALALAWFCLPETSKVPLEDITELYETHRLWRRVAQGGSKQQKQKQQRRAGGGGSSSGGDGGGDGGSKSSNVPAAAALAGRGTGATTGSAAGAAAAVSAAPFQQQQQDRAALPRPPDAAAAAGGDDDVAEVLLTPFGLQDVQAAAAAAAAHQSASSEEPAVAVTGSGGSPPTSPADAAAIAAAASAAHAAALASLDVSSGAASSAGLLPRTSLLLPRGSSALGGSGRQRLPRTLTLQGVSSWLAGGVSSLRRGSLPAQQEQPGGDDDEQGWHADDAMDGLADELRHEG